MKLPRLLSLLLTLAMLLSVSAFAVTQNDDYTGKVVIIHTNDTHGGDLAVEGQRLGTAGIAQLKKDYQADGAEVILVSAGDATQGDPLVNLSKGKTAIGFMNAAGYDLIVPGNHEFDWGVENLLALEKEADFPVICANIFKSDNQEALFNTQLTFETKLGKIGFFGLTTPETATKAHPDKVKGLSFDAGTDMYADAKAQVDALKAAGCVYIICVGHLGDDDGAAPNRSIDVIAAVPGIDVFIDGHSHSVLNGEDSANKHGDTLLVSAGEKTNNAGIVVLSKDTVKAGLISAADYKLADETVAAAIKIVSDETEKVLSEKFAATEVLLDGNRDPGVRTQETNLGDFAADAILWSASFALGEGKVDAALTNGGGIRASIAKGDVTMKDMATVFPYGNTIATLELTGAQLLEALEAACYCAPKASGSFPQVSGMEFTIDSSVPYKNGAQYADSTYFAPANPGARIKNVKIGTEALDLKKTYTIATNDFTAAGGDTFGVFKACKVYNTGLALEDALVAYTSEVLGGKISAEKYGKSGSRIVYAEAPATGFADVSPSAWYAESVKDAVEAGLMTGIGGGLFNPEGTVTRAMVVQMIYRLEGEPILKYIRAPEPVFDDLESGAWYEAAANWAGTCGIVKGIAAADGKMNFAPNVYVSREQLASILYNYERFKGGGFVGSWMFRPDFSDAGTISDWAYEAVCWMSMKGVMQGAGGSFTPGGTATRAQLAKVFVTYSSLERDITQKLGAA